MRTTRMVTAAAVTVFLASAIPADAGVDPVASPAIEYVAGFLRERGFYLGPDVTKPTPELRDAVILFQAATGNEPDGRIDGRLMRTIVTAPPVFGKAVGTRPIAAEPRAEVRFVKEALARLGLYNGRIDGKMDAATRTAITAFEARKGLPRRGVIDKALLAYLSSVE